MKRAIPYLLIVFLGSGTAFAEFDVDQADSLDFESFHQSKDNALTLFDKKEDKKEPDQESAGKKTAPTASDRNAGTSDQKGNEWLQLRERYSLADSEDNRFNVLFAIRALHQQMAATCPQGWNKRAEWSEPAGNDYYLYFAFSCLAQSASE